MRIWFDTEFIDAGPTVDLISIGAVREDGMEYYAESAECRLAEASAWVQEHVFPGLDGHGILRSQIAAEFKEFCGPAPEFWTYFGAYDWFCLCQLYGCMINIPQTWPYGVMDVHQLAKMLHEKQKPKQGGVLHNALDDARWTKLYWEMLVKKARH